MSTLDRGIARVVAALNNLLLSRSQDRKTRGAVREKIDQLDRRYEYHAFLSFSGDPDRALARALRRNLRRVATHWWERSRLKVFLDEENLAVGPDLSGGLEHALDASSSLVLLACTESAERPAVLSELCHWIEHRPDDKPLIVQTGGELAWSNPLQDFDWTLTTAVPTNLFSRLYAKEPVWVDLRTAKDHPRLRRAVVRQGAAKVAAEIFSIDPERLGGYERRRHRREVLAVISLIAVTIASTATGGWAAVSAQHQHNVAEHSRRVAMGREILAQADTARANGDLRKAARLNLAAQVIDPSEQARSRIVRTASETTIVSSLADHNNMVTSVSFSPDGYTLATTATDGTHLWDVRSASHPISIENVVADDGAAMVSAYAPTGATIATGFVGGKLSLWDVAPGARATKIGSSIQASRDTLESVVFSPDGQTLATSGYDGVVRLFHLGADRHLTLVGLALHCQTAGATSLAFSPDGKTLATACWNGEILLWDVTNPAPHRLWQPLKGHTDLVWSVAFSPEGTMLASAGRDHVVRLWDLTKPAQPAPIGEPLAAHNDSVNAIAFSPDGTMLASGSSDRTILLWSLTDRQKPTRVGSPLIGHTSGVTSVAFSRDGKTLASGSTDATVLLWDLSRDNQATRIGQPVYHDGGIWAVAISHNGHTLASAGIDHTIRLWNLSGHDQPSPIGVPLLGHTDDVRTLSISPNDRVLASGGTDRTVRLWDISNPAETQPLSNPLLGYSDIVSSVLFSADGQTLITAGGKTIILWDVHNLQQPARLGAPLDGHDDWITSIALSPNGHILAAGARDGIVLLWDISSPLHPRRLARLTDSSSVWCLSFSPDGNTLAGGDQNRTISLWDVGQPSDPHRLGQSVTGHTDAVWAARFSPDGTLLATAGADNTILLWDLSDRSQPVNLGPPLTGHTGWISALDFTPNGVSLISAAHDWTVIVWDLRPVIESRIEADDRACEIAGRGLDAQEWGDYIRDVSYVDTCAGRS